MVAFKYFINLCITFSTTIEFFFVKKYFFS